MSTATKASDTAHAAVKLIDLAHTYPGRRSAETAARPALDGVSLEVREGEIFGILGPNGGGKSTLLRVLATLLRPDRGSVHIFGHDALNDPTAVRPLMGLVFQNPSLDIKLTARENMVHQGHLYNMRGNELSQRIDELLAFFNLQKRQNEYVENFSGGMRRRVEVAKAMLHRPRLLLMDEPSTGLDPGVRVEMWQLLMQLQQEMGMTIVLTTHLMDEADRCDRLAVMADGKRVALDTPGKLKASIGGDVVTMELRPEHANEGGASPEQVAQQITDKFGPWSDRAAPRVIERKILFEKPDAASLVPQLAADFGEQMVSITVGPPTLEDVFMHLTGQSLRND